MHVIRILMGVRQLTGSAKEVLQQVPYPVYVLTASRPAGTGVAGAPGAGKYNGSVVTWATQVEMADPAKVAVAVAKSDYTYEFVQAGRAFALHLLGKDQIDLAKRFGFQSGRQVDKFAGLPYEVGETGAPIVKDALSYVECRVTQSLDTGPHVVFVGEVTGGGILSDGQPMMAQDLFAAMQG